MKVKVQRLGVREGYDRWSATYDETSNPLVALDDQHSLALLDPRPGERILDAACGTGRHLARLVQAETRPVGLDFARGMLRAARQRLPQALLVQADLHHGLPLRRGSLDAALFALVGEHLTGLDVVFLEAHAVLKRGGRLVFSVFHPELAATGIEANFEQHGTEYRLGAERHSVEDYLDAVRGAGFRDVKWREYAGDSSLARRIPKAAKYVGRKLLLIVSARA